ncbi:MAG TPA: thiolase family protein [Candidatus Kapabacteria bacterium]|nr:thiolase family protein [Candidatus Kapabacteria bacterium]
MNSVVILSSARTPIGNFMGSLAEMTAPQLGSVAIKAAIERSGVKPNEINEVLMGCVLTGGIGQAPARQASLGAGIPDTVPCTTVNKVCGSGMKTIMLGTQSIMTGDNQLVLAGGMESMTNAPYVLPKARGGYKMGNGTMIDSMINDGLWDPYNNFHMGNCGEICARDVKITREEQDEFAIRSFKLANESLDKGYFKDEIVPVVVPKGKETMMVNEDEGPRKVKYEKIPTLKPSFDKNGTITPANASSINDGAAAVVLANDEYANKNGLKPSAKIIAYSSYAHEPILFTTAPVTSIELVLKRANMTVKDIDLFEINEAFAVVPIAAERQLGIPREKLNVMGGAIALGHPIGASGTRIVMTLLTALKKYNKKIGLASICIGGGEATSMIVERI